MQFKPYVYRYIYVYIYHFVCVPFNVISSLEVNIFLLYSDGTLKCYEMLCNLEIEIYLCEDYIIYN